MTKGEYRIGIDFNPSNDDTVNKIKRAAADLFDLIDSVDETPDKDKNRTAEIIRAKAQALRYVENASMWGVKSATRPPMKG